MKIVVLDGAAVNPGDLSWAPLEALGECEVYPRTAPEEVLARAQGAEVLLTNKTVLTSEVVAQLDGLRYIGVLATGTNVVDVKGAKSRGIVVTNIPMYSTASVAQLVFAHILHWAHDVAGHAQSVRDGQWSRSEDFSYWLQPLRELTGLTLGIIGFGAIGQATAQLARAFGMQVVANTHIANQELPHETRWALLDDLLQESDVVSLHCPLLPQTRHLINEARLRQMKPDALLVNTSRGPLIDEDALAKALAEGWIGGAGLDVLAVEPPPAQHPLYEAPHCTITPHIAWATQTARTRLMDIAISNVKAFLEDNPQNTL